VSLTCSRAEGKGRDSRYGVGGGRRACVKNSTSARASATSAQDAPVKPLIMRLHFVPQSSLAESYSSVLANDMSSHAPSSDH